jgi:hypothetical protein
MEYEPPDFAGLPLDRTTVAQSLLNIDNKKRNNLLPWKGQFSPQLIEILLRTYAPKNGLVFDPFAGSGTVLHEAGSLGMPAVGSEINPAASKMAQMYCLINTPVAQRRAMTIELERALEDCVPEKEPSLFSVNGNGTPKGIKESLVNLTEWLGNPAIRSILEALIVLLDFYTEGIEERLYGTWAEV